MSADHRRVMVEHLSAQINRSLSQPTRNKVLFTVADIRDLCRELLQHNQQGELDRAEMIGKTESIAEAALEIKKALEEM